MTDSSNITRGEFQEAINAIQSVRKETALLGVPCATRVASFGHAGGKTAEAEQLVTATAEKLGVSSKVKHTFVRTVGGIRLVYGNWSKAGERIPANPLIVKAGVETSTNKFVPVSFSGRETVTIPRGGLAISDVIGALDSVAGGFFWSHTYVSVAAAGEKWPVDLTTVSGELEGVTATNVDRTLENIAASNTLCYSPVNIVGVAPAVSQPIVAKIGDSIISGKEDAPIDAGWFNRGVGAEYGIINLSKGGESAKSFAAINSSQARMQLIDGATRAVVAYGTNDIGAENETAQELKENLELVWSRLLRHGIGKLWAATIPPNPTSSDGFATVANQTVNAKKAIFDEVNAWLRTVPRPLTGIVDVAAKIESEPGSGKWKAPGFTAEGTHPSQIGHETMATAIVKDMFV